MDNTIEDLIKDIPGLVTDPANDDQQDPAPDTDPAPASDQGQPAPNGTEGEPNKDGDDTPPAKDPEPDNTQQKANQAFAQMRVKLNQSQQVLKDIAHALGLTKSDDESDISKAITDKIVELKAKQTGVPEEFMKEFQELKANQENYLASQKREKITRDLSDLQTEFSLGDVDLRSFVDELVKDNINPYTTEVDLKVEYIKRNFGKLIDNAVERGRKEEAKRAATANSSASNPGNAHGSNVDGKAASQKIDSISALNDILDNLNKK